MADKLKLSRTTISDALRDSPRVDSETRARVKAFAKKVGYVRNPLASALMSEIRRSNGSVFRGVLAALEFNEQGRPETSLPYHHELLQAAEARATELDFKFERFSVGAPLMPIPRLNFVLQSRGIHGIMLLPSWGDPDLSQLDWTQFAGVYTDYVIERPALNAVCPDHYRSLLTALALVTSRGYVRPALALQRHVDERLQYRWLAAFRTYQTNNPQAGNVPPLIADLVTHENFTPWFQKHQPDVVFAHSPNVIEWMESCGAKIPQTHGFACLNVLRSRRACAGLDLQPGLVGARAAELLIAQVQRSEKGIPESPSTMALPARWVEGPTLRTGKKAR